MVHAVRVLSEVIERAWRVHLVYLVHFVRVRIVCQFSANETTF